MQTDTSNQRLVFISHSSKDTWVAKQIARCVHDCGAISFLDEHSINIGADFDEEIRKSLNEAHELLVLLTPWALTRPYIWAELGVAWGRDILIIGILYGVTETELQTTPSIPVFLKRRNLIEINDLNSYLQQLKARVDTGPTDQQEAGT